MRLVSLLVGEWRVTDTFLYSKILLRRTGIPKFSASGGVLGNFLGFPPCYGLALTREGVKPKNDPIFQNFPPAAGPKNIDFWCFGALWEFGIFQNFPPAAGYQHVIFS